MSEDVSELQERIRVRAYFIWLSEGCRSGLEEEYWRRAEGLEADRPNQRVESLPQSAVCNAEIRASEVGKLTQDHPGVVFSSEEVMTNSTESEVLRPNSDGAGESDSRAEESEKDLMGKKKKDLRASVMSFLNSLRPSTNETVEVTAPTAAEQVTSGAEAASKSASLAEQETLAPAIPPSTSLHPESKVEAEEAVGNPAAELASPVEASPVAEVQSQPQTEMSAQAGLTVEVAAPTAAEPVTSGTEADSNSSSLAEQETLAPAIPPSTSLNLESKVEAEEAVGNSPAELTSPVEASPVAEMQSQPQTEASARAGLRAEIERNASYFHHFESVATPHSMAKGMIATFKTEADGVEYLSLANGVADAKSHGEPEGYTLRLPDEVERAASGNRVIVRAVARASGVDKAMFALAYSTNEVGNSGWRRFAVGEQWSVVSFEYPVAKMIGGHGDFLSVLAEPTGNPGVDVFCVSVEVVANGSAG